MSLPKKNPLQMQNVYALQSLTMGGLTILRDAMPLGEVWYTLMLDFYIAFTNTTGTTALVDGLKNIIKDIMLKTDRDDIIVKACGHALYERASFLNKIAPDMTTLAATAGTYKISIPINLANPDMRRPEDCALNTARYKSIELHITTGAVADLLGSVGDCALTSIKVDVNVLKSVFPADASNAPKALPYIYALPPVNPASATFVELEKNPNLALTKVFMATQNSATAGVPFSGTRAHTVLADVTVEDNERFLFRKTPVGTLRSENILNNYRDMSTGIYVLDFARDKSVLSAYLTGGKSKLQVNWTNGTLSTSQVSLLLDGIKTFRA